MHMSYYLVQGSDRLSSECRLTLEPDIHQDMDHVCQMKATKNHFSSYPTEIRVRHGDSKIALAATTFDLVEHELTKK
jgi:hypothetical protein